jgi:hypothetical protein
MGVKLTNIQCAIIRTMKSHKKMAYVELIAETIRQIQPRFTPAPSDIKKYIDSLIEKEFLKRLEGDFLGYLA